MIWADPLKVTAWDAVKVDCEVPNCVEPTITLRFWKLVDDAEVVTVMFDTFTASAADAVKTKEPIFTFGAPRANVCVPTALFLAAVKELAEMVSAPPVAEPLLAVWLDV